MLLKSTSTHDDLDDLVLGEFAGAPQITSVPAAEQPAPQEVFQATLIAEEVVEPEVPQFLVKGRGNGFGSRLASAFSRSAPEEARFAEAQPVTSAQVAAPTPPPPGPARPAPTAAPAPVSASTDAGNPPRAAAAKAPPNSGAVPQPRKGVPRVDPPTTRLSKFKLPRRTGMAVAFASAIAFAGWAGFAAGQKSPHAQPSSAADAATNNTAPAFGLASPIAVSAPAQPIASAASAPPSAASLSSPLVPDAVLAAASANLPPMASLPPAVDEHKVDQQPVATRPPAVAPVAAKQGAAQQGGAQQPDGLIALGGEAQQGQAVERVVAAPANTGATESKRATPARQPVAAASAVAKPEASDPIGGNVRKLKYGNMGITALTATSVVLVNGKQGQFAVSKGQALPDGSIVQSVDAHNNRISTNHGVIQLD